MSAGGFIVPFDDALVPQGAAIAYAVLCSFAFILIVSSLATQCKAPAPYGKFADGKEAATNAVIPERSFGVEGGVSQSILGSGPTAEAPPTAPQPPSSAPAGGCGVPQRVAHVLSDFPAGFVLPIVLYSCLSNARRSAPASVLLALWLCHYIHRGLLHPLTMRYSDKTTPLGICVGGMIPNFTFAAASTLHLAYVDYSSPAYFYDPRFIIGVLVFIIGYVINRWADWKLRALRDNGGEEAAAAAAAGRRVYRVPRGGLFELVTNPNYFGELVEWCGFALATSSLFGVLWVLFALSTFVPRSLATRAWYSRTFPASDLPQNGSPSWKALIPFVL